MKKDEMDNLINNVRTKLGEENAGLIADDLATLMTDNTTVNTIILQKDNEINKLKQDKENLISVNGNLLQQVGFPQKEDEKEEEKPKNNPHDFDFKKAFNEKGEFI